MISDRFLCDAFRCAFDTGAETTGMALDGALGCTRFGQSSPRPFGLFLHEAGSRCRVRFALGEDPNSLARPGPMALGLLQIQGARAARAQSLTLAALDAAGALLCLLAPSLRGSRERLGLLSLSSKSAVLDRALLDALPLHAQERLERVLATHAEKPTGKARRWHSLTQLPSVTRARWTRPSRIPLEFAR